MNVNVTIKKIENQTRLKPPNFGNCSHLWYAYSANAYGHIKSKHENTLALVSATYKASRISYELYVVSNDDDDRQPTKPNEQRARLCIFQIIMPHPLQRTHVPADICLEKFEIQMRARKP